MPYKFETQPQDGYLLYTVSGTIDSVADGLEYVKAIVISAQKQGHYRILIDERTATKKMDQHDCVTWANEWTSRRSPTGIRVATVYSPAELQNFHWVETILQNRSIVCKIFDDMNEAREWLMA